MSIAVNTNCKAKRNAGGLQVKVRKAKALPAKSAKAIKSVTLSQIKGSSYMLIEVGEDGRIDSGLNVNPRDAGQMVDALILMLAKARRIEQKDGI